MYFCLWSKESIITWKWGNNDIFTYKLIPYIQLLIMLSGKNFDTVMYDFSELIMKSGRMTQNNGNGHLIDTRWYENYGKTRTVAQYTYSGASPGSSTSTLVWRWLGSCLGNVPLHEAIGVITDTPIISLLGERATSITSLNPLSNSKH